MELEHLACFLRDKCSKTKAQTILITGVNSGIGLYAAKLLACINPRNRLILVARTQEKAEDAKEEILSVLRRENISIERSRLVCIACEHCSLDSVRQFSHNLRELLSLETNTNNTCTRSSNGDYYYERQSGIDVMCLNAGVLLSKGSTPVFTEDGFETTFQTNYLASFMMMNLTCDLLNPGGRVIVSTSGLYAFSRLAFDGALDYRTGNVRKRFEMMDGNPFHFKKSYALSKLCSVAFCVELDQRLRSRRVVANCFSPGLMTTSGLFRNQPNNGESIIHNKVALLNEKTVEWGAGALVFMAIADETGLRGGEYWEDKKSRSCSASCYGRGFCPSLVLNEEIDKEKRETLWNLSSRLVRIPNNLLPRSEESSCI